MKFATELGRLFSPNVVTKYVANSEAQNALNALPKAKLPEIYRHGYPQGEIHPLEDYARINNRALTEYCALSAMQPEDILNLAHPETMHKKLERPLRVGDIGCGKAVALASFYGNPHVQAVGIDKKATDVQVGNVIIYGGDAEDKNSQFWALPYDYLFCVLSAHYIDRHLTVIKRMKSCLAKGGKGYVVVPSEQVSEISGMNYIFDAESLKHGPFSEHGLRIITDVPDNTGVPRNIGTGGEICVAIQFGN